MQGSVGSVGTSTSSLPASPSVGSEGAILSITAHTECLVCGLPKPADNLTRTKTLWQCACESYNR
eukprot:6486057-Amphidinium_carterae.2